MAGTAAAAAAVAPFSVASGFFSIVAGACFLNNPCSERDIDRFFYTSGVQSIVFPVRASYRFLRSDCLAGAIGSLNAFPSAMTYVTRPRLSTAIIAAGTAAQISAELTRYYSGALTDEERAFLDAHGSAISRTDTPLAMSSQSSESPAVPSGVSAIDGTSRWYFPETEVDAIAFNAFQAQVTETAEYRNPHSKPGVVRRIDLLVEAMRASPSLRATCFAIASDAAQTCGDRVALGLNDMEQALLIENAESGKLSPEDLFSKGIGSFKKQVLDEIALAKINDLKRLGIPADEIEIRLAFQTELFERLDLPGVTNEMRYRASAKVSKGEIASAERAVRQKIAQGDAISFLTQWRPWCKAMEKTDPEAFRALADAAQAKRDAISIMPAHMSDQEWINALAKQKNDEETQTADLLKRTTLRFISEHGLQVA